MRSNKVVFLRSPRLQKKKRRKILYKFIGFVLLFVVLIIGLAYLFKAEFLLIKKIKIYGNQIIDTAHVEKEVSNLLFGTSFVIFPRSNIFFYPRNQIINTLRSQLPRIENLDIGLDKNVLEINIEEKKAIALWCNDSCYFLDSTGFIFSPAPSFSGGVYKIYSGMILDDPLRKQYLSSEILSGLEKIYKDSELLGFTIEKIHASSTKEIKLTSNTGMIVIVDMTKDPSDTSSNLSAVLNSDEFKAGKIDISKLDYIDLRYGSKIYFKVKE